MDTDKQRELINDTMFGESNCCGARIYMPDICSDCKEHCESVKSEDYPFEHLSKLLSWANTKLLGLLK